MEANYTRIFASQLGEELYARIENTLVITGMDKRLSSGVLVGFSGGADSLLLLAFLCEYRRRNYDFEIISCHVNHMIRAEEALRDEAFSAACADSFGGVHVSERIDVPRLANERGIGLEEAARDARYSCFANIISGRNKNMVIAVAHNATDNLETVLFNILRGSGLRGGAGIPPVRDNVIRPLIDIPKGEIVTLLRAADIDFCFDSTNDSSDYTRNYIRNEILPRLSRISVNAEESVGRFSKITREADDFLLDLAEEYISSPNALTVESLSELHSALFSRVFMLLATKNGAKAPEYCHITKARRLLPRGDFSLSLPGSVRFVSEGGLCRFESDTPDEDYSELVFELKPGKNELLPFDAVVFVGDTDDNSSNVYKFSTRAYILPDIIDNGLCLRFRRDGDSYRYGNMTHKLKKVFNDREILPSRRGRIPVICDKDGIVFVPGLPVRDGAGDKNGVPITVSFSRGESLIPLYTAVKSKCRGE
jgi:tRNA(Ile)-lysidine synthase